MSLEGTLGPTTVPENAAGMGGVLEWALPAEFELDIALRSDWHIGTGAGRPGDVDRLVAADAAGLPYLPAKTVTGAWRDACEVAARALDGGGVEGSWHAWVRWLFGGEPSREEGRPEDRPLAAGLSVRSAHLPPALIRHLGQGQGRPELTEAVTFVKPGVRIDPQTERALDDHLRFLEMARGGVTLTAACELAPGLTGEQRLAASALLLAGASLLQRIGGQRRRGAGRCEATVRGAGDLGAVWDWLETDQGSPIPAVRAEPEAASVGGPDSGDDDGDWLVVPLEINLQSPVVVSPETSGNVTRCGDVLPGSALLAVVTAALKGVVDVRALVQSGELCVLAATPEVGGQRGRPVPAAFFVEKGAKFGRSGRAYNRIEERVDPGIQVKGVRDGYVGPTDAVLLPELVHTAKQIHTHSTIDEDAQRPTTKVGGVFTYEALSPDQRFRSEIRISRRAASRLKPRWWSALNGMRRIGRSKKDDYGRVEISAGDPIGFLPSSPPPASGRCLHVWLQSTVLLRDARLRPTISVHTLRSELSAELGVRLGPLEATAHGDDRIVQAVRAGREESWHVGWGLPRPSLVGLEPGGCVVFAVQGEIDPRRWATVQARGIGERRAEGFGQVSLGDPLVTGPLAGRTPAGERDGGSAPSGRAPTTLGQGETGFDYARVIERAAWRTAIQRAAAGLADSPERRKEALGFEEQKPSRAQAGALRGATANLGALGDGRIGLWLQHLTASTKARKQWPEKALPCLRSVLTEPSRVWTLLALPEERLQLTTADLRAELWAESVRTLLDACVRVHTRLLQARADAGRGA